MYRFAQKRETIDLDSTKIYISALQSSVEEKETNCISTELALSHPSLKHSLYYKYPLPHTLLLNTRGQEKKKRQLQPSCPILLPLPQSLPSNSPVTKLNKLAEPHNPTSPAPVANESAPSSSSLIVPKTIPTMKITS